MPFNAKVDLSECVERLIRSRRSTRAFLPDPVPQETIQRIFELARMSPSGSNSQPWLTHVVSGALRDRLSAAVVAAADAGQLSLDWPYAQYPSAGIHHERRQAQGATIYGALGIARQDAEGRAMAIRRNLQLFGAPHVALLFMPDFADVRTSQDVGMYGQTLMLAMAGYGVDSCAMGVLGFHAGTIKQVLGVPASLKMLYGVAFGYADPDAPANRVSMPRAPLQETTVFRS